MKHLIFLTLLSLSTSTVAGSIHEAGSTEIPAPWREVTRMEFNRFGDHLFGYATVMEASNKTKFLEIRFSNGTRTKYNMGVGMICEDSSGKTIAKQTYSRDVGWSSSGSVEKSGEFIIKCPGSKMKFGWVHNHNDIINLDDMLNKAESAAKSASLSAITGSADIFN